MIITPLYTQVNIFLNMDIILPISASHVCKTLRLNFRNYVKQFYDFYRIKIKLALTNFDFFTVKGLKTTFFLPTSEPFLCSPCVVLTIKHINT